MDTKRFFETAIPQMIVKQWELFTALQGSIAIEVKEHGAWTIDFGTLTRPVTSEFSEVADLRMWFTPEGFAGFVAGKLDVVSAITNGDIVAQGDFGLLERLGQLLQPPMTVLGLRLGT